MARTAPIEIKRHYRTLSEKETDELVGAIADLIVAFVRNGGKRPDNSKGKAGRPPDRNAQDQ